MGLWAVTNADSIADVETKMFVGSEDLLYKLSQGFHNFSNGVDKGDAYEADFANRGFSYVKEIWQKTMADKVKTSSTTWQSFDLYPVTGTFTAEFDAVPNKNNIDCIIGIQDGTASAYADQACAVRFYSNGKIEARNGSGYATSSVSYTMGKRYHIRMEINVTNHTYTIYVKPAGGSEVNLGTNYAFRTDQASVTQLTGWSLASSSLSTGSLRATNMAFTNTSSSSWQSFTVSTQTDIFTAEFDAVPNNSSMNGVIGIQNGTASAYTDQACGVRFYSNGYIEARNGSAYQASTLTYSAGVKYHFRLVINRPSHTYSIYVTPDGGEQVTLGTDYSFRTEQATVAQLTGWSMVSPTGTMTVSDMMFYCLKSASIITNNQPLIENNGEQSIRLYPNPLGKNKNLTVNLDNINDPQATIVITDLQGRTVYKNQLNGNGEVSFCPNINLSGIYIVSVSSGSKMISRKIIVH